MTHAPALQSSNGSYGMAPGVAIAVFHIALADELQRLEEHERAMPRLSDIEIARFDQITAARGLHDARLWRGAHIALRMVLERFTGPGVRGAPYHVAAGGRPSLPRQCDLAAWPQFSLSHSAEAVLIGVSHAGPIGVDIEALRPVSVSDERRQRLEAAAQMLEPAASLPEVRDARFLQAWVRLEALAKATGLGIGRILTEAKRLQLASPSTGEARELAFSWPVRDIDVGPQFSAAMCVAEMPPIVLVHAFPDGDLP